MKKIIVTMLALTMSMFMLVGCTTDNENDVNSTTTANTTKDLGDNIDSALDNASKAVDSAVTTTTKAG